MKRNLFVLAILLLTTAHAEAQVGKGGANKYGWHSDFMAAKAEAKRSGKPIFLVFRCEP